MKIEQQSRDLFRISCFDGGGEITGPIKGISSYRIEDRILFIDLVINQGYLIGIIESLKSTKKVVMEHYSSDGDVFIKMTANCEFINTPSFSSNLFSKKYSISLQCSFVMKDFEIVEIPEENKWASKKIKLF